MQLAVFFLIIFASCSIVFGQRQKEDLRISRFKGNIFRNLTETHEYEDHIVTSLLDNSNFIRMIYRGIREVYSRLVPGTGERHDSEKFQKRVPATTKFPCRVEGFKSTKVPKSVHQLRPGGKIQSNYIIKINVTEL